MMVPGMRSARSGVSNACSSFSRSSGTIWGAAVSATSTAKCPPRASVTMRCRISSEPRRQIRELLLIGVFHPRRQAVAGQGILERGADLRRLIGVIDLLASDAPADPGGGHALGIPDQRHLMLEGEIARRRGPRIEMLMED